MLNSGFTLKIEALPKTRKFLLVFSGLLLTAASFDSVKAQGNLLISPRRVVFDGEKRSQELNLANTGKDTAKYVVSFMEIRMTENGAFEEINQPVSGQRFASKFLRFFPRSVTLAPNEAQSIKVQVTKASTMESGEYRSHIYFRAVPNERPLGEGGEVAKDSGITVRLTPVFGITIPVIIRIGESDTKVGLSDVSFGMVGDTIPRIGMMLTRSGNMSAYGDITVEHIGEDGKITEVGMARGVAVYTPNLRRRFNFDLYRNTGIDFKKGKLKVSFAEQADDLPRGRKPEPLAQTEYSLKGY